jgi:uncharacterized protein YdaU (DUF1376 family)
MPFYFADYLADTGHLSVAEHGAYFLLIAHYWSHGGLPADEAVIARITRMTPRQWSQSRDVLRSLFGDDWRHKRIDKELAKAIEKSQVNSANAQRRHSERTAKTQRTHTQPQPQSQPEEKKEESSLRSDSARDVSRAISDDWPPDYREQFWNAYPRKVGRKAAFAKLKTLRSSGEVTFAKLIAGVRAIRVGEPRFIPHPTTWLNRGGWDDDPAAAFGGNDGFRGSRPLQDDRLSVSAAIDRRLEQAGQGALSFPPRPRLLPQEREDDRLLLPQGRSAQS